MRTLFSLLVAFGAVTTTAAQESQYLWAPPAVGQMTSEPASPPYAAINPPLPTVEPLPLPPVGQYPATMAQPVSYENMAAPPPAAVAVAVAGAAPADAAPKYYTMDELKGEMKKLAWTKGDFTITPYGILWFNMAYETSRTNDGDLVFFVYSPDDPRGGRDDFNLNARATRLGLDVTGPKIPAFCDAATAGRVEIDFFGASLQTENRPGVLLRHAYVEVKNDEFRWLMGQTFDVMSPLVPGTLLYTVGWGAGNIGFRRAQFRGERYMAFSDELLVTATSALAADLVSDFGPTIAGDHAGWPVVEGRLGATLGPRGTGCRPLNVGLSGHIGEQLFDVPALQPDDIVRQTWSVSLDANYPITARFGVQGEVFMGKNLGAYQGGILQGVNLVTGEAIHSRGGWVDAWYDITPKTHTHAGYGVDDPRNRDITAGRTYNDFVFTNLSYDLMKQFLVGVEYTHWTTRYDTLADAASDRVEFVAKYGF